VTIRSSEVHLYYNLQVFYWHFLESLWLFIFLVLFKVFTGSSCWYTRRMVN
jgi:heme/copper-type cytochrome/quinol oxidase subunit 3